MEESVSLQAAKNNDTCLEAFQEKMGDDKNSGNDAMEKGYERRNLLKMG
jgi:hypothetical protein